jgi:RHS repeat-associated protein
MKNNFGLKEKQMKQQLKLICEQNLLETGEFMVRSGKTKVSVYKESPSLCKAARWSALLLCIFFFVSPSVRMTGNDNVAVTPTGAIDEQNTNPESNCTSDPINIMNGAVLLDETDLVVTAPLINLTLSRAWISGHDIETDLGDGWTHSYDWRLNRGQTNLTRLEGTFLGVPGNYVVLDAPSNPMMGKYNGGQYFFREVSVTNNWPQWEEGTLHAAVMPQVLHFFVADGTGMGGAYLYVDKNESTQITSWTLCGFGGSGCIYKFDQWGYLSEIFYPEGASVSIYYDIDGKIEYVQHSNGQCLYFHYASEKLWKVTTDDPNLWVEYSRTNYSSGDYTKMFQVTRHVSTNIVDSLDFKYFYNGITNIATGTVSNDVIVKKENPVGDFFHWSYSNTSDYGLLATANWVTPTGGGTFYDASLVYDDSSIDVRTTTMTMSRANNITATNVYTHDISKMVTPTIEGPLVGQVERRIYDDYSNFRTNKFELGDDYFTIKTDYDDDRNPTTGYIGYNTTRYSVDTRMTWNADRMLASVRDSLNRGFKIEYKNSMPVKLDAIGPASADVMTLGLYNYDTEGKLIAITNANSHVTSIFYASANGDGITRQIVVTPPLGSSSIFYTDDEWRVKEFEEFDAEGYPVTTSISIDYAGKPLSIIDALGQVSTFEYDKLGRLTRAQDAGGRFITNTWRLGKLLSSTIGKNGDTTTATTTFDYDPQMTTLHIKDPMNRVVEGYTLDAAGRVIAVTNIDGLTMTISRGVLGMQKEVKRFDGIDINFEYNSKGELSSQRSPTRTNNYLYWGNGLLKSITSRNNFVSFNYDVWNRLTNFTTVVGGRTNINSYDYDNFGNLTVQTNGADVATYAYDDNERLSSISHATNNVGTFNYIYDDFRGNLSCVSNTATQFRTEYEYDLLGRVTGIVYRNGGGVVLRSIEYSYDASGLITNKIVLGTGMMSQASSYTYDALGQLISERTPGFVTNTYTYNAAGNRTSAVLKGVSCSYTTPAAHNRLASWTGGGSMNYNTGGCVTNFNRANKVDISSLSWNCVYQLTDAVVGSSSVAYTYDVMGRKASRTQGGVTEHYLYDEDHVVADTDNNGSFLRTYTYGPEIDDILSMTDHTSTSTNTYYFLKDLSNTVLALVNSSGNVVESYVYDAYGNVTIKNGSGNVIPTSAYGNRFLFQGREYDYTTQLYNFRARWYDPETGRWLSNDPIGISGGLNLYAFCGNDPVNFVDPMGEKILAIRNTEFAGHEYLMIVYSDGSVKYLHATPTHSDTSGGYACVFVSRMQINLGDNIEQKEHKILCEYETTDIENDDLINWACNNYDINGLNENRNNPFYIFPLIPINTCRNFSADVQVQIKKITGIIPPINQEIINTYRYFHP